MPDPLWTGIRRHGAGWRATVSAGRGVSPIQRHFPREATPAEMQAWRADTRASARLTRKARATAGMFEADARRYLASITALTTYQDRALDIARWVAIFGRKRRERITSAEIRRWRDRWLKEPRRLHPPPGAPARPSRPDLKADTPYAASTVNHWLRALSNLWTVLDGRRAPNPVREVPEAEEPDALPRAVPYALIEQILGAIRQRKGETAVTPIRLRVMAHTGLTAAQLGRLTRADVDFEAASMLVQRRRKGRGAKARRIGLIPAAVDAFRALDAAKGWGPFSTSGAHTVFQRAYAKVQRAAPDLAWPPLRPYDLRHTFGALVYKSTKSLSAVRELLSHATTKTTERYTLSAVDDVLAAHVRQVASSQSREPDGKP